MAGLKIKAKAHTSWHRCSRSSGASWKSWRGTAETNPSPNQWDWCPFSQPLRHLNISQYFLFSDVVPLQVDTLPMEAEHTMPSPTVPVGDSEAWQPRFRVQYWSGNSHHVNQYFFYACICTYTCIYTCIYMIIYGDDNYDELLIEICVHVVYTWQYLRTWYSNSTMCIIKPRFLCMHLHVYMCIYIYVYIYIYMIIYGDDNYDELLSSSYVCNIHVTISAHMVFQQYHLYNYKSMYMHVPLRCNLQRPLQSRRWCRPRSVPQRGREWKRAGRERRGRKPQRLAPKQASQSHPKQLVTAPSRDLASWSSTWRRKDQKQTPQFLR